MVHEAWVSYLAKPTALADIDDQVIRLSQDAGEIQGAPRLVCDGETASRVLRPICEGVGALATLARKWQPDDILADDVDTALVQVKTKRMAAIQQQLQKSDLGRKVVSICALVLQSSGQAAAADEKLLRVQQLLNDDRLPSVKDKDDIQTLVHGDMVASMLVVDVLGEALDFLKQPIG